MWDMDNTGPPFFSLDSNSVHQTQHCYIRRHGGSEPPPLKILIFVAKSLNSNFCMKKVLRSNALFLFQRGLYWRIKTRIALNYIYKGNLWHPMKIFSAPTWGHAGDQKPTTYFHTKIHPSTTTNPQQCCIFFNFNINFFVLKLILLYLYICSCCNIFLHLLQAQALADYLEDPLTQVAASH